MTRLWLEGMPIRVKLDAQGKLQRFLWQGQSYRVDHIWRHWQVDSDWWSEDGRVWREYLLVTTHNNLLCQLYQDLLSEEWYFVRFYN